MGLGVLEVLGVWGFWGFRGFGGLGVWGLRVFVKLLFPSATSDATPEDPGVRRGSLTLMTPLASRVPLPHQASTQAAQIAGFRALGFRIWGFTGLGLVGFIGFGV